MKVIIFILIYIFPLTSFSQEKGDPTFYGSKVCTFPTNILHYPYDTITVYFDNFAKDEIKLFCDGVCIYSCDTFYSSIERNERDYVKFKFYVKKEENQIRKYTFLYKEKYDKSYYYTDDSLGKSLNLPTKIYELMINHTRDGYYISIDTYITEATIFSSDRLVGNMNICFSISKDKNKFEFDEINQE